jgi:hypothetical protein
MQPLFEIRPSLNEQLAMASPLLGEMLADVAPGQKCIVFLG